MRRKKWYFEQVFLLERKFGDMKKKNLVKKICLGGVFGALYAALTLLLAPISFGVNGLDLRVAEALTLLPVLMPESVPGLAIGCLAANLICGAPWQDVVFGTLATLAAALLTRKFRKNVYLAAAMPVICNTVIVGSVLVWAYGLGGTFWSSVVCYLFVGVGEGLVCYLLGIPMLHGLRRAHADQWLQ